MEVHERMRAEWNERAREDAHYFVAFGRRDQDDEEFFATAVDVVRELEQELKRLSASVPVASRRALEIGCGPGRLMRPMSRYFGEIHGVDVSDEMIRKAKEKLRGVTHAHAHHSSGSDLAQFPDEYFDFVYSYAVFQHIPSAEVVFSYLRETVRVLRPGGVARLHINGLPKTAKAYTTWEGVRISDTEVREFTITQGVQLLSLTGVGTQYMWTTWRKPLACAVRAITNAFSSERTVPSSGRMACAALSISNLPEDCDLNSLRVLIDGAEGVVAFVGPRAANGSTQINVFLPPGVRTGLVPVVLESYGRSLCPVSWMRVITAGPSVPRLRGLSDGVNLLSPQRIESGLMKATIEEAGDIGGFRATVDGLPVQNIETFRTDPLADLWEVNFAIPKSIRSGGHALDVWLGRRLLAHTGVEVIR